MKEKIAIIDLGTNTFHLLIAYFSPETQEMEVLQKKQIPVKLGQKVYQNKEISEEALERAAKAFDSFKALVEAEHVSRIKILGTSALRTAENAQVVQLMVEKAFGVQLEIIDGAREAQLIYKGVNRLMEFPSERPILIIDIGGGSVECIIAHEGKAVWYQSLDIGTAYMIDQFPHHYPIEHEEFIDIYDYLQDKMQDVLIKAAEYKVKSMVGTSGSFETVVYNERHTIKSDFNGELPDHCEIQLKNFRLLYRQILGSDRKQLSMIPGIPEFRVEMIVVAMTIINLLIEQLQITQLHFCNEALKEGAVVDAFKQPQSG